MERERVLVETFSVSKKDEKKLLEIRIPLDAWRITGLWVSCRFPQAHSSEVTASHSGIFTMYPNYVVGDLRLFSLGKERNFFSFQLSLDEKENAAFGDVSQTGFSPKPWSHAMQPDFVRVDIPVRSRLLKGYYRDRMEEYIGFSSYEVKVYIWYSIKEKQETPQS